MSTYFKLLILLLCSILVRTEELNAQFYIGGGMKFNSNDEFKALALHLKAGKDIAEKFDINTDIAYYLASKASWSFDFDLQYHLVNLNDNFLLRPFAGINFTKTSVVNNSLAFGISMKIPTDKYTYYLEPRWILDNSQLVLTVGVSYPGK